MVSIQRAGKQQQDGISNQSINLKEKKIKPPGFDFLSLFQLLLLASLELMTI